MDIPEQSTTPIYASKNPSRNFDRLCQLIMTVCVDLFRDVLDFFIEPAELSTEIRENFEYFSAMMTYQPDDLFFLEDVTLSSKFFDLSQLYIVIRSVCCIPQPTNAWGSSPETDDRSLAASIERIRISGIKILDYSEEIDDIDFQNIWQNLRTNIDDIQRLVFQKNTYAEAVDELFSHEHISTRYRDRFQRLKGENCVYLNAYLTYFHIMFYSAVAQWARAYASNAEGCCSNHSCNGPS